MLADWENKLKVQRRLIEKTRIGAYLRAATENPTISDTRAP